MSHASGKRKKRKVRSAWISFLGRIVAQVVGAVASVVLGLAVLHKYSDRQQASEPPAKADRPVVVVVVEGPVDRDHLAQAIAAGLAGVESPRAIIGPTPDASSTAGRPGGSARGDRVPGDVRRELTLQPLAW
jgi:hypothetical protein